MPPWGHLPKSPFTLPSLNFTAAFSIMLSFGSKLLEMHFRQMLNCFVLLFSRNSFLRGFHMKGLSPTTPSFASALSPPLDPSFGCVTLLLQLFFSFPSLRIDVFSCFALQLRSSGRDWVGGKYESIRILAGSGSLRNHEWWIDAANIRPGLKK